MLILWAIFLLLALEIITAFVIYPLKTGKTYYELAAQQKFIYQRDPVLGFALKPSYTHIKPPLPHPSSPKKTVTFDVRTNKEGFIGTEDVSYMKGRLIFCLGDSVAMSSECRHDRTPAAIIDSLVMESGYRCVNAAVGGYRSVHELLFFKNRVLPYKPYAVIVFSGYNDFEDYAYGFSRPDNPFKHCLAYYLSGNRLFYYSAILHKWERYVYEMAGWMRAKTIPARVKLKMREALRKSDWLDEWRRNIAEIAKLCKENDIRCYMVSCASPAYSGAGPEAQEAARRELGMTDEFDTYARYSALMNKETRDLCDKTGAMFLDLSPFLDRMSDADRFSLFFDRMHYTEQGAEFVARSIYGLMKDSL